VNEFDSDRKMMSVVIRLPDNVHNGSKLLKKRHLLLCKGADSSVLMNCVSNGNPYLEHCKAHIDYFANTGLRTLVLSYRELDDQEVENWLQLYQEAGNSLTNRTELMKACAHKIEKDLILVGAIGIEGIFSVPCEPFTFFLSISAASSFLLLFFLECNCCCLQMSYRMESRKQLR
jgi:magnesium-transporting ATPase (P-type)